MKRGGIPLVDLGSVAKVRPVLGTRLPLGDNNARGIATADQRRFAGGRRFAPVHPNDP